MLGVEHAALVLGEARADQGDQVVGVGVDGRPHRRFDVAAIRRRSASMLGAPPQWDRPVALGPVPRTGSYRRRRVSRTFDELDLVRKTGHLDVVAVDLDGHPRSGQRDALAPSGSACPAGNRGASHVWP